MFKHPADNYDYLRFGKDNITRKWGAGEILFALLSVLKNNKKLYSTYSLLNDERSRKIFHELIILRTVGSYHMKIFRNNENFWELYKDAETKYLDNNNTFNSSGFNINSYKINSGSNDIKVNVHPLSILCLFLLRQYEYKSKDVEISVKPGDNIIDAGACWGDSSIYFADRAGSKGKVYSFEFEKNNLNVFHNNLKLNPFAGNVIITNNALWSNSGEELRFKEGGPGTTIMRSDSDKTVSVKTLSIDDFVKTENISRIDFIKMDIEGAELEALRGAENTIIKFKPRLAVSLYHSFRDFHTIPSYLKELNDKYKLGYKFYLDHFTIYEEETVLFAIAV